MIKVRNFFNVKWLMVAVTFTATVVFLSHLPQGVAPFPLQENHLEKLAHALAYGAITYLLILSLRARITVLSASLLFLAILAVGTLDELTQPFFNRTASLMDSLANIVGIIIVLLCFVWFKNSKRQASMNTDI